MKITQWPVLIACVLALFGCEVPEESGPGPIGVCEHTYEDEVLHIDGAQGRGTGAVIAQVVLSSFVVNGVPVTAQFVSEIRALNITLEGDLTYCTLPCSFGTESGTWEFVAEAVGYLATPQVIDTSYELFSGGCPSYEDQGTHTSLLLDESV